MNIIKRLSGLLLSFIMIFSFSACTGKYEADSFFVSRKDIAGKVSADTGKKSLYISADKDSLVSVAKSDIIQLFFSRENCSISVYDTASGKLWNSLPDYDTGVKASVINLTVLIDGNKYTLSSQSDSVASASAVYEVQENGLSLQYTFKKTLEDGRKLDITVPVSYTLTDGALKVEIDCEGIRGKDNDEGIIITDIDILPFFGANRDVREDDYILLPDGSGATVALSENPGEFEEITLPVYEDGVLLGAFGMKNSESAFAALIDDGAEIASVKMTKALTKKGCNSVWPSFRITDTLEKEEGVYVSSEVYKGKIGVAYRFLSFDNADYIGMASAVRELLIRDGRLLSSSVDESTKYPFNMSITFQNYITDSKGKLLSQTLTTYEQAQELISSVKAKGIENINLRLKGIFTAESIEKAGISREPGKLKSFGELINYSRSAGVTLYADAGIITSPLNKSFDEEGVTLDSEGMKYKDYAVASFKEISDNVNSLLSILRSENIDGVCISDAGKLIYADYTVGSKASRADVAESLSTELGALSASGQLMVDTGNIYAVKYASFIDNLPSGSLSDRSLCSTVPFIQAILHGITEYSLSPVNLSENPEKAFLKAVEYGAVPSYSWYAAELSSPDKTDYSSYLNYLTQAQSQYERASDCFSDLRGARITDHYRVRKNVYYTRYDNGAGIYVNYTEKPVTVSGVTVEGMSFLRVG